jgi:hypothetical protein
MLKKVSRLPDCKQLTSRQAGGDRRVLWISRTQRPQRKTNHNRPFADIADFASLRENLSMRVFPQPASEQVCLWIQVGEFA